jgi:hypothetical protein
VSPPAVTEDIDVDFDVDVNLDKPTASVTIPTRSDICLYAHGFLLLTVDSGSLETSRRGPKRISPDVMTEYAPTRPLKIR